MSENEGLGRTSLVEHVIDTGNIRPIKQKLYQMSPAGVKVICEEIDRMISLGVIEEADRCFGSQTRQGAILFRLKKAK